jgi:hypothetical protein
MIMAAMKEGSPEWWKAQQAAKAKELERQRLQGAAGTKARTEVNKTVVSDKPAESNWFDRLTGKGLTSKREAEIKAATGE